MEALNNFFVETPVDKFWNDCRLRSVYSTSVVFYMNAGIVYLNLG